MIFVLCNLIKLDILMTQMKLWSLYPQSPAYSADFAVDRGHAISESGVVLRKSAYT
jgi:hypothetical protein